jgi:hypothetical protein
MQSSIPFPLAMDHTVDYENEDDDEDERNSSWEGGNVAD